MTDLGRIALALPDVHQGLACVGTALESATYGVRGKTFLFVSPREARLRLDASAGAARKLGLQVGANGWVKLPLDALPPARTLKRWIAESHALLARPAAAKPRASARTVTGTKRPAVKVAPAKASKRLATRRSKP